MDKVQYIIKSLNIPASRYDSKLNDLRCLISYFSDSLKRTCISNSNLNNNLSRVTFKNEERIIKIDALEVQLNRSRDDAILLKRDNQVILKQRNTFFLIAKRLYFNISQLQLNCEVGNCFHKMTLPFLELKKMKLMKNVISVNLLFFPEMIFRVCIKLYLRKLKNSSTPKKT